MRKKRAFKVKQKVFSIIFKALLVIKNCLRSYSAPLKAFTLERQRKPSISWEYFEHMLFLLDIQFKKKRSEKTEGKHVTQKKEKKLVYERFEIYNKIKYKINIE